MSIITEGFRSNEDPNPQNCELSLENKKIWTKHVSEQEDQSIKEI